MFCPKCGTELPDGAQACASCGAVITQPAPAEASAAPAGVTVDTSKGASKRAVAVGLVVIVVAAAVVVAGMLTNWFGLAKGEDQGQGQGQGKEVYVATKATYYDVSDGSVTREAYYTVDDHGGIVGIKFVPEFEQDEKYDSYGVLQPGGGTQTYHYDVDEHGYTKSSTVTETVDGSVVFDGYGDNDREYDSNGRLTSMATSSVFKPADGDSGRKTIDSVNTYEYYPNGMIKSLAVVSTARYTDWATGYGSGRKSKKASFETETRMTTEYDERGYIVHSESTMSNIGNTGDTSNASTDYVWEFDDEGRPTARTLTQSDESGTYSIKYTFDTDDAGNITVAYTESGRKYAEYEYKRIDDPSDAAKTRVISL